ncbi:MAG: 2'-5' RNA ligase family protein [Candidatus Paceibacterota bacterium]|jgi:hypothetical protein
MADTEQELSHSFNVKLSRELSQELFAIQKQLRKNISERRDYDPSPHLAIATKFMRGSDTQKFIQALSGEFSEDRAWDLAFVGFSPSETGDYIFLNLSEESKETLRALHKRALATTKGVGFEGIGGLPPKYAYDPHISIIKLQPKEVSLAMEIIGGGFSRAAMKVNSYEVTRQENDKLGFGNFPALKEIRLKS